MMNKKQVKQEGSVLVIVLAIAVLVLGAAIFYFFRKSHKAPTTNTANSTQKSTTEATKDTKSTDTTKTDTPASDITTTYEDPTWHYSFKYPKTWTIDSRDGDATIKSSDYKEKDSGIGGEIVTGARIRVYMEKRDPNYTTTRDLLGTVAIWDTKATNINYLKIASYDAVQGDSGYEGGFWTKSVFAYRNKSQITIYYDYGNGQKSDHLNVYQDLLSSFSIAP